MTFDPLVSNAGRLRILTALAEEPRGQAFVQLRSRTGLTDGNLKYAFPFSSASNANEMIIRTYLEKHL